MTRTLFMLLADSAGQPAPNIVGTLYIADLPQDLDSGHWLIDSPRQATSNDAGRIEWPSVPIGAKVSIEIPGAEQYIVVTVVAGVGDQQV